MYSQIIRADEHAVLSIRLTIGSKILFMDGNKKYNSTVNDIKNAMKYSKLSTASSKRYRNIISNVINT